MKSKILIFFMLISLLVAGCNQTASPQAQTTERAVWEVPKPAEGTGVIKGVLKGRDGNIRVGGHHSYPKT